MESELKRQRLYTLEDLAKATGMPEETLRDRLPPQGAVDMQEAASAEDLAIMTVAMKSAQEDIRILKATTATTEQIANEVSTEFFKKNVRIEGKGGMKAKTFHETIRKFLAAQARSQHHPHRHVARRHSDEGAHRAQETGAVGKGPALPLEAARKDASRPSLRPHRRSAEAASQAHVQDSVGPHRARNGNMDDKVPSTHKPATRWPCKEAKTPKWSMEIDDTTFCTADFDTVQKAMTITMKKEFYIKEAKLDGTEILKEFAQKWAHPFKLLVKGVERDTVLEMRAERQRQR
eukprot:TRINITY_DN90765_c0_g1_i1.p1 TRINITY_DN90765_c0_g1~~TRINITY_DN90765_c0_g1_i1.p1  ORF type:complete len:316 (+),score=62.52 TRINITY_DN90765_c0_g1_i1:76-948(+)